MRWHAYLRFIVKIIFEHSPALILLCVIVGVFVALWLYRRTPRIEAPKAYVIILATMRGLAVALLCFLLLGPMTRHTTTNFEKPTLIWLQDNSASIAMSKDSAFIRSAYSDKIKTTLSQLENDFQIQLLGFGESTLSKPASFTFDESVTDFSQSLASVNSRFYGQNIGAIVLASDGIYNRGTSPLYAARNLNVPIYTVALGDTSAQKDLWIEKVRYNSIAYEGNQFPIEVLVKSEGLGDASLPLTVASGDQTVRDTIRLRKGIGKMQVLLEAKAEGLQRIAIDVATLPNESSDQNNREVVYVEVLKGRQKVLLLANGPHPDLGAIRRGLGTVDQFEVTIAYTDDFHEKLEGYNLCIIHNMPSAASDKDILKTINKSKVSLLVILGNNINVNELNKLNLGVRIQGNRQNNQLYQPYYNADFTPFALTETQRKLLESLPPISGPFGNYSLNYQSEALLTQRIGQVNTEAPLLWFSQLEDRKVGFLAGEGLWKWQIYAGSKAKQPEALNELIRKIVVYLAEKDEKSRFKVNASSKFAAYQPVTFKTETYDAVYERIGDVPIQLTITDEEGKSYEFDYSSSIGHSPFSVGRMEPGLYEYKASCQMGSEIFKEKGAFAVEAVYREMLDLRANHQLLFQIAEEHGGAMIAKDGLGELPQLLAQNADIKILSHDSTDYTKWIDWKWLFAIAMALFTIEWFLRKRAGGY